MTSTRQPKVITSDEAQAWLAGQGATGLEAAVHDAVADAGAGTVGMDQVQIAYRQDPDIPDPARLVVTVWVDPADVNDASFKIADDIQANVLKWAQRTLPAETSALIGQRLLVLTDVE
ncbi:MAG: hypothetical protein ACOC5K_03765 [Chloroflexota bacterium]